MIKKGDIVYTLDINQRLVVTISKILIKSHELRNNEELIDWYNLENNTIRDFEIPIKSDEERTLSGNTISGFGTLKDYSFDMFTREYVTKAIFKKKAELNALKIKQDIRDSKFVCPLTGGKIIKQKDHDRKVLGGYGQKYKVENSTHVWKTMDRVDPYGLLFTTYENTDYYFLFDETCLTWKQYSKIGNGYFYPYPNNLIDKISIYYKESKFRFKEFVNDIKKYYSKKKVGLSLNIKPVYAQTIACDLVEVKPMEAPISTIMFFDDTSNNRTLPIYREISIKDL